MTTTINSLYTADEVSFQLRDSRARFLAQTRAVHTFGDHDVVLGLLPFFHIYGLTVIMNLAVSTGATIVKAYQVPPAELEALLVTHPAVADAAVVPSPDEEAGEVPKAYVVLKDEVTPEEIMAFVAERVAPHKKVRRLEVVDAIPKSPSGKILRRVLVERERGGVAAAKAPT